MSEIKLIIIEDHTMVREMWKVLLTRENGFNIIADCGSANEAKKIIRENKADVIMLDINLAGDSAFDLMPDIAHHAPESKVLIVSMHNIISYIKKILRMGARGYITKNSTNQELIEAIRKVADGKKYICKEVQELISHETLYADDKTPDLNKLSHRELQIVQLLKKGKSSKEIAEILDISQRTAEVHRYNILRKLNFKNTASLLSYISKTQLGI